MPSTPPSIFTPPSGSTPAAPGGVFTPVGGGGSPDAPGGVFTAPSGSSPAAPGAVFSPGSHTPNYLETAFAGTNNDLRFEQANPAIIPSIRFAMVSALAGGSTGVVVTGSTVTINLATNFGANYTTAAEVKTLIQASAEALELISVSFKTGNDGTGAICQPATTNVASGPTSLSGGDAITAPGGVFTPPGGSTPASPAAVFTPAGGGGSPDAPGGVFTPITGGGSPDAPGAVFTPLGAAAPDAPPPIFGIHEDAVLGESGEEITTEGNEDYIAEEG